MSNERFPLVDGKCPVCDTVVEHEVDGVRVRFMPHDDPDVCRGLAQSNARALKRALEQANEDRALAQYRESFYRAAFRLALRDLAQIDGDDPDEYRALIERRVRDEMKAAKERADLAAVELKARGLTPLGRQLFGDGEDPRR